MATRAEHFPIDDPGMLPQYREVGIASSDSRAAPARRTKIAVMAAFPLAALVTLASLGGILIPSLYARESPNWAAQAVGQDWMDLLIAVPWLATTSVLAKRGSPRALSLLAGGILFTAYTFVIYALGMHFNAMFLVYCGTLGISLFALSSLAVGLLSEDTTIQCPTTVATRIAGYFLVAVGMLFGVAWLAEIVPAILGNTVPHAIAEAGTPTNPVYVIDLSVLLPLQIAAGVALLRGRTLGWLLAPGMLAFGVLMALSIAGMMLVMRIRGVDANLGVATVMVAIGLLNGLVLWWFPQRPASRCA